jgi:hypothetical protein
MLVWTAYSMHSKRYLAQFMEMVMACWDEMQEKPCAKVQCSSIQPVAHQSYTRNKVFPRRTLSTSFFSRSLRKPPFLICYAI